VARFVNIGTGIAAIMIVGGSAYAAAQAHLRADMPEFVIDVRAADSSDSSPGLMLISGEDGSDPFLSGKMKPGQRISDCRTVGSRCVSQAARKGFWSTETVRQSLQIRLFNGHGNPIVGGIVWNGPGHPDRVRVTCDLRVSDPRRSCAVLDRTA
jgi:hypothetical protein